MCLIIVSVFFDSLCMSVYNSQKSSVVDFFCVNKSSGVTFSSRTLFLLMLHISTFTIKTSLDIHNSLI